MLSFLVIGTIFGLSAGIAPGPLLALVISETIQNDIKAGIKVACSPIISDLPIILLTMLIFSKISHFHNLLGLLSIFGGFFILFMGYKNITSKEIKADSQQMKADSLIKGILVNSLSPYPYLFWLSVGTPLLSKAMSQNTLFAIAFVSSFYVFLIGSKIILAIIVGKWKVFLTGKAYYYILRLLGLILCIIAIILFKDGFILLGVF